VKKPVSKFAFRIQPAALHHGEGGGGGCRGGRQEGGRVQGGAVRDVCVELHENLLLDKLNPELESAWIQTLSLKCDLLVSSLCFQFSFNRYIPGLKIMNKKMMDEEEEDLFSLSGTSKGKKSKKKQRSADSDEPKGPNPKERLNISFDAYAHFSKLGLTAPQLAGEVPAMMNSLKEKKELFLEKRKIKKVGLCSS
jgi:hypothetical protein